MSTQYHISTITNKAGVCKATKRACRYGAHYSSFTEANNNIVNTKISNLKKSIASTKTIDPKNLPPIDIPDSPMYEPYGKYTYLWGFETTDSHDTEPWPDDYREGDYIHHDNPIVIYVDLPAVISGLYGTHEDMLPKDILEFCEKQGWGSPSYYTASSEQDYYEDKVIVEIPDEMTAKLKEKYWELPNAVDDAGILKYCRSKGFDTTGKTPVEAIKAQLEAENAPHSSSKVKAAENAEVLFLDEKQITITKQKHYANVVAKKPESKMSTPVKSITGVVVREGDKYVLVDGYHRMKALSLSKNKSKRGHFIVLS